MASAAKEAATRSCRVPIMSWARTANCPYAQLSDAVRPRERRAARCRVDVDTPCGSYRRSNCAGDDRNPSERFVPSGTMEVEVVKEEDEEEEEEEKEEEDAIPISKRKGE